MAADIIFNCMIIKTTEIESLKDSFEHGHFAKDVRTANNFGICFESFS